MDMHPMSEPWLNWQPIKTFPQDGEAYLATNDGFPQVVFWDVGRLYVPDASISYMPEFFTHWAKIPMRT